MRVEMPRRGWGGPYGSVDQVRRRHRGSIGLERHLLGDHCRVALGAWRDPRRPLVGHRRSLRGSRGRLRHLRVPRPELRSSYLTWSLGPS